MVASTCLRSFQLYGDKALSTNIHADKNCCVSNQVYQSMLNSSYDKTGLNLKFERAFLLVLENILGPSAVTHHIVGGSQQCRDSQVI